MEPSGFCILAFVNRTWLQFADDIAVSTVSCGTVIVEAASHDATSVGVACGASENTVGFVVLV
jgi:hypothetical protein